MKFTQPGVLLTTVFAIFALGCSQSEPQKIALSGSTMGTTYHISYVGAENHQLKPHELKPHELKPNQLQKDIDQALAEVNQVASTYIEDSELSLFNQHQSREPFAASPALILMVREAIRLAEVTAGALDVTVGPLVNLWGFGPNFTPEKAPTEAQILAVKAKVGVQFLRLTENRDGDNQLGKGSITKDKEDIYVDLSSLAKGYGVDVVADLLEENGIHNYLVEIGGEMRLRGKPSPEREWRIAVEKPVINARDLQRIIEPKDNAVATSGDYRNFFEQDGVRYSHLIDPTTGRPINHRLVSATVLHPSCMVADGLATGFMILGQDKALALANEQNIAALFIVKSEDGQFVELTSNTMPQYLVE